jgi:hypothetical protein
MKLKLSFFTFLMIVLSIIGSTAKSQNHESGKIGLAYSINAGSIFNNPLPGSSVKYSVSSASGFELIYFYPTSKSIEWETGVNYSLFNISSKQATLLDSTYTISVVSLPIGVRASLDKIFFINGGLLFDFDMNSYAPVSHQTGIGMYAGLGGKYDFKFGGSIFVNPFVKIHSLIPYTSWKNHQRLFDGGVKIGFTYQL